MSNIATQETAVRPWMNGFDAVYDEIFFDTLGKGTERQFKLSELGVLSYDPDFTNRIPNEAIVCIKKEQSYNGMTDAIKFAFGARAAFETLETEVANV